MGGIGVAHRCALCDSIIRPVQPLSDAYIRTYTSQQECEVIVRERSSRLLLAHK